MTINTSKPNLATERYCHRCHKLKAIQSFAKRLSILRFAGVCIECNKPKHTASKRTR